MKKLMTSLMALVLSYSMAEAVQTSIEKGDVKQSFSDTMKYAARGFKSCTDTCIVGKDSYDKVCKVPKTKEWCKKNCEHKKFMMGGEQRTFSVDAKCKMTLNKAGDILKDFVDDTGKKFKASVDQFVTSVDKSIAKNKVENKESPECQSKCYTSSVLCQHKNKEWCKQNCKIDDKCKKIS